MKGILSCKCGQVKIEIGDPSPRMRIECGCCDCRQAMAWAQLQGGPKVPSNRPLDLWYFGNDISVATGKDKLKWFKLRENGKVCKLREIFLDNVSNKTDNIKSY